MCAEAQMKFEVRAMPVVNSKKQGRILAELHQAFVQSLPG